MGIKTNKQSITAVQSLSALLGQFSASIQKIWRAFALSGVVFGTA